MRRGSASSATWHTWWGTRASLTPSCRSGQRCAGGGGAVGQCCVWQQAVGMRPAGSDCTARSPCPSPQAYVEQFKFQSITADDALNFFLEFFPDLKKQGVESRPGQRRVQHLGGSQPSSIRTQQAAGLPSTVRAWLHGSQLLGFRPSAGLIADPSVCWSWGSALLSAPSRSFLCLAANPALGSSWGCAGSCGTPGAPHVGLESPQCSSPHLCRSGVRSLAQHARLAALPARPFPGAAADEAGR